ncbi:MAG: eukaryotic-like serine/threonine-protein kinase [Pyrinomonadaceae bacterium]|nr:eukaryotic-like serine/threonine-protein kinase [Pyrinomonadaceae bacterium]
MMIEPGALLQNRYRVVKQIGQGGMGAVYVATDERFHSTVAIKQTFFDDPTLRKAFEREAHLLNHLRHVALPRVSDHFVEGDGQFLVMEFIEGTELAESLQRRGAFPLTEVLRWADELLDALDYLHTHEPPIVHRDIKPQNMKLTPRGRIVLLDFGLAKGAATETRASQTASVFGYSRSYAPLEQIQGTGTDTRSDLYSLGATLYHLLTGVAPVDGLTRAGAVINQQPDPLRPAHLAHAQVPESISKILHRAMALKAALRPATAAEMRAALRQATNAISRTTPQALAAHTHGQPARYEATMLDGGTQMFDGQQATPSMISQTRVRPPVSLTQDEATLVDSSLDLTRPSIKSYSHASFQEPPAESERKKSPALMIGVVLAVLVACAFVAIPRLRSPAASSSDSGAQTLTQPGATVEAQGIAPDATQADATRQTSNSTSASESGRSPSLDTRTAVESQAPAGQTSSVEAEGAGNSAANADGSKNLSPTVETPASRSGLVIQSPASNSSPVGQNNAAAEYDAQRAEELRRRRQQQEAELQQQRQREQEGFRPPPPPPHEGGFPPPGGEHRPPPRRAPPMR